MGCALTKTEDEHNSVQAPIQSEELGVFVPGLRLPRKLEVLQHEDLNASTMDMIERLTSLHSRLAFAAEDLAFPKKKLKKHRSALNVSSVTQLRETSEEHLAVLLKLLKTDPQLANHLQFTWTNQEDEIKETTVCSPYYEMLSVLQLLATLSLLEANKALVFKPPAEGSHHKQILDDNKRTAMDVLFKAAQILECALKSVLPQAPRDVRNQLPADLTEAVLQALQLQALALTVEIQLGLAIDNAKATMAVKRRLACEVLKYWQQAYENLQIVHLGNGWAEKHLLFIKWKRTEAKAAAYYFHSLILDECLDENGAAACLRASEHFFKESERVWNDLNATAPMTKMVVGRSASWGPMKHLSERFRKDVTSDCFDAKNIDKLQLPDFELALQVDEYQMPECDEEARRIDKDVPAAEGRGSIIEALP